MGFAAQHQQASIPTDPTLIKCSWLECVLGGQRAKSSLGQILLCSASEKG
jgi:hypothetical protein